MVFAGLRALEAAGQRPNSLNSTHAAGTPVAQVLLAQAGNRPEGLNSNVTGSTTTSNALPQSPSHSSTQPSDRNTVTPEGVSYNNAAAQNAALGAYSAFERSANEDLERNVGNTIDRTLDQALPHATRTDSAVMKTRLAATIRQDVEKALQGDRQLGEQVAQILSARRFDSEARASVVRLIGERAQQLVPGAARRVLSEWTQTTLAAHRGQRDREDSATSRREVESVRPADGSVNSSRTNTASASRAAATAASSQRSNQASTQRRQDAGPRESTRRVDYRRLSDEQILDS
jgi:hypothetical protein